MKELVDRFLAWPLPSTVCSDLCATKPNFPHRTGTTLLSAIEAEEMLKHVVGPIINERDQLRQQLAERDAEIERLRARKCSHGPYEMYGTDGCDGCDFGRIEMYRLSKYCLECQRKHSPNSGGGT